jgi:hypothetical protein
LDKRLYYFDNIILSIDDSPALVRLVRSEVKNELDDLFGTVGSSVDRAWKDLDAGSVGG